MSAATANWSKPMFFREFPHSLAHGDDVGFFVDPDLPSVCVVMTVSPDGDKHFHGSLLQPPEILTAGLEVRVPSSSESAV